MSGIVRVAAAVLIRPDGAVLLAQRPPGKPYEGYWEFPGGKLEPGESAAAALSRELHEELGITVRRSCPWLTQEFVYPHAHVELRFFRVYEWEGEIHGRDGQDFRWQEPGRFDVAPLLPANTRVLTALALPPVYGITCAEDVGEDEFLISAKRAFANGLKLVQVREKGWPAARREAFIARLRKLAEPFGVTLLANGSEAEARALRLAGVHWTSAQLRSASARATDMVVAASCHTRDDVARAAALGLDFCVLGPVCATPTHPDAAALGFTRFGEMIDGCRLPVYALGGLSSADLSRARAAGAHGVALRRHAWPAT